MIKECEINPHNYGLFTINSIRNTFHYVCRKCKHHVATVGKMQMKNDRIKNIL